VNKTAPSPTQLAKCILLHAYSRTNTAPSCAVVTGGSLTRRSKRTFTVF